MFFPDAIPCDFRICPNIELISLLIIHFKAANYGAASKLYSVYFFLVDFIAIVIFSRLHKNNVEALIQFFSYNFFGLKLSQFKVLEQAGQKNLENVVNLPSEKWVLNLGEVFHFLSLFFKILLLLLVMLDFFLKIVLNFFIDNLRELEEFIGILVIIYDFINSSLKNINKSCFLEGPIWLLLSFKFSIFVEIKESSEPENEFFEHELSVNSHLNL
jgi:hypothetical protein